MGLAQASAERHLRLSSTITIVAVPMGYPSETAAADAGAVSFDSATGAVVYTRDDEYYVENVAFLVSNTLPSTGATLLMTCQVENYLFNVPSFTFQNAAPELSDKIRSVFNLQGKQIRPVELNGVRRIDFKRFLRVTNPK